MNVKSYVDTLLQLLRTNRLSFKYPKSAFFLAWPYKHTVFTGISAAPEKALRSNKRRI